MKTDKSAELKRLIIYLVLAFAISWIPWMILNSMYGFEAWFMGDKAFTFLWVLLISAGGPAIANVLTRLITKEGFDDGLLRLRLKGNVKYYVMAAAVPVACGLLRGLLLTLLYGDIGGEAANPGLAGISMLMYSLPLSLAMAFNTFGEEYGWRGYMNQKLGALTNKPVTIIVGGIIWGVWHAPLTVNGHNFGTDYPGFPWLGIVLMSAYCILIGIFLMWLTEKTGSIYPAAIAHSANNNGAAYSASAILRGIPENMKPSFASNQVSFFSVALVYVAFTFIAVKLSRREPAPEPAAAEA